MFSGGVVRRRERKAAAGWYTECYDWQSSVVGMEAARKVAATGPRQTKRPAAADSKAHFQFSHQKANHSGEAREPATAFTIRP